ncbi:MAG: putative endonuclease V [Prokaryotic dsDNA virus sp.]|nr:MAG: putative endonuclease V [Prokaryotic dsDNA virus sp.]|tara:strand:- start:43836 stop:44252 length:417 start_codon:yes stop_codon:yes gene_type:complete
MTRINVVPVEVLSDKHLMAEYREIPRIFTAVHKLQSENIMNPITIGIPKKYCLGIEHMKFFYNKIGWLLERYNQLIEELGKRGFKLDSDMYKAIIKNAMMLRRIYFRPYEPSPEDIYLNMARLCKRSNMEAVLDELKA